MIRRAIPACAAAAAFFCAAAPAFGQAMNLDHRTVTAIRVVDESGRILEPNLSSLPLAPGRPFHIEAERESLRQLYRTGLYADIRTQAETTAKGLAINFVVRRNFYNDVMRIEGLKEPPNESAALAALRLDLGEPFRESALHDGLQRLEGLLREDGFYRAKVESTLLPREDTRQMELEVRVLPGLRARIAAVQIRNHTAFPDRALSRKSKLAPGKPITAARLDRASERLRKFLVANGYLGARAVVRRAEYNPERNSLPVVLDVAAGPRVAVKVEGARFSAKQLRKLLPIYAEGAVDSDLLEEGRRNLRDALQRQGYFDAQVSYSSADDPQQRERAITYEVNRGQRHRLVGIALDGNHYFSSDLLRSRLQIQTETFAMRGRFSQALVRSDGESIRALYVANGFRSAQVRTEVDDNYGGKKNRLFVRFHISEGPQARVAQLHVEGNRALPDAELLSVIGSTPGQPYSESNVSSDRDNVLALYYNEGFPEARFEPEVEEGPGSHQVRLTYRITEGPQVRVDRVYLSGYHYTRPGIIRREVQIQPGGPLRQGDVVETQRRLYNLGIFNRVAIAPQNPEGTEPDKTVVVAVEEGKRYTLGYGFGFEVQRLGGAGASPVGGTLSASPRGIFEISRSNFAGRAQTLSFKASASTLQYRGLLSFSAPHFLPRPKLALLLAGFADKTRDVRTFASSRYEGSFQLTQNLSPASSVLYRYFFRKVLVDASSLRIAPQQIPLFSQPTQISGFGVTWLRDRRDNPGDAARGSFNTADASVALESLGSSASFLRVFLQNSTFHPFGRGFVFARSARLGIEHTMNGTTEAQIPLPERFFAGGGTSLRGFGLNQAGPRDPVTGFPIGGLAMVVFNQELRFPMKLPFVGNRLGGALFYDAGNVFSDASHITLRASPSLTARLNYFSHTVGFGLRYSTPIGPVRLDLGYQLNPAQFSFTNPTTNQPQVARFPHFQFFFNIGSIF